MKPQFNPMQEVDDETPPVQLKKGWQKAWKTVAEQISTSRSSSNLSDYGPYQAAADRFGLTLDEVHERV